MFRQIHKKKKNAMYSTHDTSDQMHFFREKVSIIYSLYKHKTDEYFILHIDNLIERCVL